MNQLKQKHPTKNKLLSRFNISMNGRIGTQGNQTLRLNSSKQRQDNVSRYRNHISFLQCRIEQQQATLQKLYCQADKNNSIQAKLSAQVIRLQRQNQSLLGNLYKAQNKVTRLEEKHNNSLLDKSIKKIEHELHMNQIRKKNKTLQDLEVQFPEKSIQSSNLTNLKSMKTSQWIQSQQTSFKITPPNFLKITSKIFQLNLSTTMNPESPTKRDLQKVDHNKITKLQEAIYYLKKQLKQKQKSYQQKIEQLTKQLQKLKSKQKNQSSQQKLLKKKQQTKNDILKQLGQKIKALQQKLEQKDRQIIKIQQIYSESLRQAQQMSTKLNTNIKQIIDKKQAELQQNQVQLYTCQQKIKNLQEQLQQNKNTIRRRQQQIQQYSYQINKLQQQISQLSLINSSYDQSSPLFPNKLIKCNQFKIENELHYTFNPNLSSNTSNKNQKISTMQSVSLKMSKSIQIQTFDLSTTINLNITSSKQDKQLQVDHIDNSILQQKNNLHKKLQQETIKYSDLLKKVSSLQSINLIMSSKQLDLRTTLQKINQQKQSQMKQIEKLNSTIRKFQGQVAQKQYMVAQMTQQMLLIRQKIQAEKQQVQVQYQQQKQTTLQHPTLNKEQTLDIQSLQQHFSQILAQRQQQQNHLQEVLEKQQNLCQHLQKELKQYQKKILDYQVEVSQLHNKIQEYKEVIIRYEGQLKDNKIQIDSLKKSIQELQLQKQFFQDYINKIQKGQSVY